MASVAATVSRWTGYEARALRWALRLSQREFAARLGATDKTVQNWERLLAHTQPQSVWQAALDTMLDKADEGARTRFDDLLGRTPDGNTATGATDEKPLAFTVDVGAVVDMAELLWTTDLHGSGPWSHSDIAAADLIRPAARWLVTPAEPGLADRDGGVRVGRADLDAAQTTVRMFEQLDHAFGGGHARTAAVQYLRSSIMPLLEGSYTAAIGRQLFAVATEATYKTGAMAYDIGLHNLARRYFVQALNFAHASGDRALGGKVLALMSHQANFLGEYADAVDLARAAKLGGHHQATPRVRAMYGAMEARALASLGDQRSCYQALRDMEDHFARSDSEHHDPDWIGYFGVAEFHNELAHCFAALGESAEASTHAELALAESGDQYPRSQTFCRLAVATAHLNPRHSGHRDVEQACALAESGLPSAAALKSHRVRVYLDTFSDKLDQYANSAAACGFRRQVAEFPTETPSR